MSETTPTLTINQAARETGLSPMYIRKAVREGKLETELVPVKEGAVTKRHEIKRESFDAWRAAAAIRSHREDGRSRFILYATQEEVDAIREMVDGVEVVKPTYGKKDAEPQLATEAE